ncbi:hypothetical protein [Eubacterium limosum]|uniref:hypothetical protein n=1 Tax=Eubacterium limosum TaxID=1736 RepID=UPI0022E48353|nr:hypothetical protein [Eubacterium limosum]
MKKKASLLISGITTVAMLAVAVGSFAAWNTLSASANNLQVSTSTPVELKVTGAGASGETVTKLIPGDAVAMSSAEGPEVKVGTLKAELTGVGNESTLSSIDITKGVYESPDSTDVDSDYEVILKSAGSQVTAITVDDIKVANGKTYDVYVKFANSVDNANAEAKHKNQTKTVKISLEAKKAVS